MEKENCIFCKIANGEIPKTFIYKDERFLVFLDIKPVSDGHIIITPREHIVLMQEADDVTISEIFKLTKKMMLALKKGLPCDYVQESVVGNEIPHFHIHLIPRHHGDNFRNFPTKEYKEGEEKKIIEKITQALARP
jgi:histidine triad (HIT) family protein